MLVHDRPLIRRYDGFRAFFSGAETPTSEAALDEWLRSAKVNARLKDINTVLAIHAGQRDGDRIRLRASNFDGESLSLKQSKTKARVPEHCSDTLRRILDSTPRQGPYTLTRADVRPWFT